MICRPHDMKSACQTALSNRLFVPGWELRKDMRDHIKYDNYIRHIALYYNEETPVAVGIVTRWNDVKIFVRVKHRRKGIGRQLVEVLREKMEADGLLEKMDAGYGAPGSLEFWAACGVPLWEEL